ncbi:hypothetical protein BX666DRAFT_1951287 [Dichotomocladium elegans]|nr:hypothetical protein BX666DRAFT_1951287 [Dichotomocladium elegans]
MSDLNWCTYCDNAINPYSDSLYCGERCLQADALRNHPLLGYNWHEFEDFPRPAFPSSSISSSKSSNKLTRSPAFSPSLMASSSTSTSSSTTQIPSHFDFLPLSASNYDAPSKQPSAAEFLKHAA